MPEYAAMTYRKQRITRAMRLEVAARMGLAPGFTARVACVYCGCTLIADWTDPNRVRFFDADGRATPEIDHIVPLSQGGAHHVDNLQLACLKCNRSKGSKRL